MRLTEEQYATLPHAGAEDREWIPMALRQPFETEPTEREFQARLLEVARLRRWRHYHTHDSRRSPIGFPDLVLVRERVIWRELKTSRGRVTQQQREWIDALRAARQDAKVWRPKDWIEVLETLF